MNRTQVIAPLIVLAIVAVVLAANQGRKAYNYFVTTRSWNIGEDLIKTTNSLHLVQIGAGLTEQLSRLLNSSTRVAEVLMGDEPAAAGDGVADSRLVLVNEQGKRLGIRLRQDADPEKFHVLGYWNLNDAQSLK